MSTKRFMTKQKNCYINGKFVPLKKARVSVLDLGILRSYGIFEFMRSYNGKVLGFDKHINRLFYSAGLIRLKLPWSKKEIKNIIQKTIKRSKLVNAGIRVVITGGKPNKDMITPKGKLTIFIIVEKIQNYPKKCYTQGIKVIATKFNRPHPEAKTIYYIPAIIALLEAAKKKAFDALFLNRKNEILEGTTSNFLAIKKDELIAPKDGVLSGITRGVVLKLAKPYFKKISQKPLSYHFLRKIDEAFLTSTTKEILPVVQVDKIKIGRGIVGEKTKLLMREFKNLIKNF